MKRKNDKVSVFFCPDCRSTKVKFVFGFSNLFGIIPKQKCFTCGFSAPQFPVFETTKSELAKKQKKIDEREKQRQLKEDGKPLAKKKIKKATKKSKKVVRR